MKITAAVVPGRGQPFEIQTLDLAPPRAGEVLFEIPGKNQDRRG